MRIGHPKWEMRHAGHEKVMFYYQLLPILVPFRGIFSPCEYLDLVMEYLKILGKV